MIPEIEVACRGKGYFINSVTVGQYRDYVGLMEKNNSDSMKDAIFFNKKILQGMLDDKVSLAELGEMDVSEFLVAVKQIHSVMQDVVSRRMLEVAHMDSDEDEAVEKEDSAFDEYDEEFGYEEDVEEGERNVWKTCGEIIDRIVKISIRLMRNSYSQCMGEDMLSLLEYLKFELNTLDESQGEW